MKIYVDDILFGILNEFFYKGLSKLMTKEFEVSMMG